ncbi:MAG TPA: leucyl aminopeptidase, partial [Myxococcota bacterium]|nr:leucyl aminopeptidase [Myxococcota bacterium]
GILGLGLAHEQSVDLFRRAGGESFRLAHKKRVKKLDIALPEKTTVPLFDVVQALTEGIQLASYQFDRYQTKDKKTNPVNEIEIHLPTAPTAEQKRGISRAEIISQGVCLARDLINEGPLVLNPVKFAEHAKTISQEAGLAIEVLDEKRLKKEKMALMLAVASAALEASPPRLVRLHYKPRRSSKRKIVLVGKGVTFDSGGLDIKPAEGMLDMKIDMSGAAAVLGTMYALGKLAPRVEVIGYMALVENGVGPHAYHPGDILISRKGLTVEINNTDAEGRLILADTFTYAIDHDKPDTIIDIATLTGACMVALGVKTAGIFANDDGLFEAILGSGVTVGEAYWRLPLNPALKEVLKSPLADIKNCGDRYGGAITAALFLEHFVDQGTKWAHLDIAGPATNNKPHAYLPTGGVGFGVRTLVDYLTGQ